MSRFLSLTVLLLAGCLASACAQLRVATDSPAVAAKAAASTPETGSPSQAPLKPFDTIVKGAAREPGFFATWRKDDKVWIEVPPAMWDQQFFFSLNVTHGIGDSKMFGNQMRGFLAAQGEYVASFRRFGTSGVQLIAHNLDHKAASDSPARFMVERSFSDSLIGQASVVSLPHPESKAVLIEANALLVNDFPMGAAQLEQTYRQSYAFDVKNSGIERVRNSTDETGFQVRAHYSLARLAVPPPNPAPGVPVPSTPGAIPDARSLFLGYYYGLSRLPQAMRPRLADPRVGYFTTAVNDYSDPLKRQPTVRYIDRWRLEKKDESAALSQPREPIVYWLDKNIPQAYRGAVTAGVLEWNKAFERIGFKNAIVVRQQGDDDSMDTSATRFTSIRWVAGEGIPFAGRAPHKVDPRTGEILDADIEINESITRLYGSRAAEDPPRPIGGGPSRPDMEACDYADAMVQEAAFGLDLLMARGEMQPGSPEAERFVLDAIKDVTTHEVGHTLGLRHNFRGSTAVTPEQLRDPAYGAEHGISGSVMDYNGVNIAARAERQGQYWMVALGNYDYWAIEYGYKQASAENEAAELARTLARAGDPGNAYATDEDAGFGTAVEGIDPEASRFDLSSDPLAFYSKRFAVVQELWSRLQSRELPPGTPYAQLRRNFDRGFNIMAQASNLAARYVGGVTVLRDMAGSGRQPLVPVDADRQRQALRLLTRSLFEVDSFAFRPDFLGSLLPDMQEREDAPQAAAYQLDYSVAQRVFGIQQAVLSQLLRDSVAARLISASERLARPERGLSLPELYGSLQQAIWRELPGHAPIAPMRRNLQREHVRLLVDTVAKANPRMPADARSLQREYAQRLLRQMHGALSSRGRGRDMIETRAHLNESISLLDGALRAKVARSLN